MIAERVINRTGVREMDLVDAIHVCRHEDPEFLRTRINAGYNEKPDDRAITLYRSAFAAWTILNKEDTPVMVGGVFDELGLNRLTFWMVPTTEFKRSFWPEVNEIGKKILEFSFELPETTRIESIIPTSIPKGKSWIERLGFTYEGTMRAYGKDGEDYLRYSLLKGEGHV